MMRILLRPVGAFNRLHPQPLSSSFVRNLHPSPIQHAKPLPPRPTVAEEDLEESFLKGSGPGGQKINKTSSAVQLKHIPTGIVVKSQATRSRSQNRKYARQLLAEKLDEMEKGDQSRTAIKAAIKSKKKASASKKARRKYRALEAEKSAAETAQSQDAGSNAEVGDQESLHESLAHDIGATPGSAAQNTR